MTGVTYDINKGINKPIEFRGLKAQYIAYLGVGLAVLLIGFAIMYLAGVPVYVSLPVVGITGSALFIGVYRYSHQYGAYGLMKAASFRQVPTAIICGSRKVFFQLSSKPNEEDHDGNGDDIIRRAGGSTSFAE